MPILFALFCPRRGQIRGSRRRPVRQVCSHRRPESRLSNHLEVDPPRFQHPEPAACHPDQKSVLAGERECDFGFEVVVSLADQPQDARSRNSENGEHAVRDYAEVPGACEVGCSVNDERRLGKRTVPEFQVARKLVPVVIMREDGRELAVGPLKLDQR